MIFGDKNTASFNATGLTNETSHTYSPGDYQAHVTVFFKTTGQNEAGDKNTNCKSPISFEADRPLGQTKSVSNITQEKNGEAAIKSVVNANDVLEYKLTTINSQDYERNKVNVTDYIGDILEYANLDTKFLKEQGGELLADTNTIVWNNVNIPANSSVDHMFRVKIKSPVPSTNTPAAVSTDFDCRISNEYGNEITMNINCPLVKGLETLPNTGPGSSVIMMSGVTVVIGYFFSRSRLLAKEIDIIRKDYVATGGV